MFINLNIIIKTTLLKAFFYFLFTFFNFLLKFFIIIIVFNLSLIFNTDIINFIIIKFSFHFCFQLNI